MGVTRGSIPWHPGARGTRADLFNYLLARREAALIRSRIFLSLQLTFLAYTFQETFFTMSSLHIYMSMDRNLNYDKKWSDGRLGIVRGRSFVNEKRLRGRNDFWSSLYPKQRISAAAISLGVGLWLLAASVVSHVANCWIPFTCDILRDFQVSLGRIVVSPEIVPCFRGTTGKNSIEFRDSLK